MEKRQPFQGYEKYLCNEEMGWRLKYRSLWINAGDKNTTYFHKKARARLWRKNIKEINTSNGEKLNIFDKIK